MAKKSKVIRETVAFTSVHLAIVSPLKPFQLAYRIDEVCGWNLQRLINLESSVRSWKRGFARFQYRPTPLDPEFYLVALKDDQDVLVKELRQFDYLLQVRLPDEESVWSVEELLLKLRGIESVVGVFEIDVNSLKQANALY